MLNPEKLAELLALDPVVPRADLPPLWPETKPTGYQISDREWLEDNRFTAVWLLENFDLICAALTAAPASAAEPVAVLEQAILAERKRISGIVMNAWIKWDERSTMTTDDLVKEIFREMEDA